MADDSCEVQPGIARLAVALNAAVPMLLAWIVAMAVLVLTIGWVPDNPYKIGIGLLGAGGVLIAIILNMVTLTELAMAQGAGRFIGFVTCLLVSSPMTYPLVAGVLIFRARVRLRRAGAKFERLRVPEREVGALRLRWCAFCGYSRGGLDQVAACPECGAEPSTPPKP